MHELCSVVQEMGASVSEDELRELIAEVDINQNATIEEEEFLQVWSCKHIHAHARARTHTHTHTHTTQMMSALKTGEVSNSRMASIVQRKRENEQKISVDRSGGGL